MELDSVALQEAAGGPAHAMARLSDTREKSDKNMLAFPTAAGLPAFYDEAKFSSNAGIPAEPCPACLPKTRQAC